MIYVTYTFHYKLNPFLEAGNGYRLVISYMYKPRPYFPAEPGSPINRNELGIVPKYYRPTSHKLDGLSQVHVNQDCKKNNSLHRYKKDSTQTFHGTLRHRKCPKRKHSSNWTCTRELLPRLLVERSTSLPNWISLDLIALAESTKSWQLWRFNDRVDCRWQISKEFSLSLSFLLKWKKRYEKKNCDELSGEYRVLFNRNMIPREVVCVYSNSWEASLLREVEQVSILGESPLG